MIGQTKLLAEIDRLIENNKFPRFSVVVGKRGAGHTDVAKYIASKFSDADYIQLTDVKIDTVRTMIKQAYSLHRCTVFCAPHADDMSINAKNALLKVVEEVPNKAYFIMCLEDLFNTLATIQSRAQVFTMQDCSSNDIAEYAKSLGVSESELDIYRDVCRTPGDANMLYVYGATNFRKYTEFVVNRILTMPSGEIFKLTDKLSFKEDDGKYDVALFLKSMQSMLLKQISADTAQKETSVRRQIVMCVGRYLADLRIKGINKIMLMDNLLLEVRRIWKSQM